MNLTPEELRQLQASNPDISVIGEESAPQPANDAQGKNTQPAQESRLERQFMTLWAILDGPELEREYIFHDSRRWRLDFAHPASKIGIEIHGGIHAKDEKKRGRHVRGVGFENDREKMNAARLMGWSVFELTPKFITADYLESMIWFVEQESTAE